LASSASANPGSASPIRIIGSARDSILKTKVEEESDALLMTVGALSRDIIAELAARAQALKEIKINLHSCYRDD
jgi:hypothetical protein